MTSATAPGTADEFHRLEAGFKQLKVAYDKYFSGVERLAPLKERDALKKLLQQLQSDAAKGGSNTARRFRLQTFQARLLSHETQWDRIAKQIEEGTYKRDRLRAERLLREQPPAEQETAKEAPAPAAAKAAGPTAPPRPTPPKAAAATGAKTPVALPAPLQQLYEAFNVARRQLGQTEPVPVEAFATTLQQQYQAIKSRFKCNTVEFKVAVKDGRAILKAVPK
jgi:hypothetical protein